MANITSQEVQYEINALLSERRINSLATGNGTINLSRRSEKLTTKDAFLIFFISLFVLGVSALLALNFLN